MNSRGTYSSRQTAWGQSPKSIPENLRPTPISFAFDQTITVAADSIPRYVDRLTYVVPRGRRLRIFNAFVRIDNIAAVYAIQIEVLRNGDVDTPLFHPSTNIGTILGFRRGRMRLAHEGNVSDAGSTTPKISNNNGIQDLFELDSLILSTYTINSGSKRFQGGVIATEFDHR